MGWRDFKSPAKKVEYVGKVEKEAVEHSLIQLIPLIPPESDLKSSEDVANLFIAGLDEDERLAYHELTEIMTSGDLNNGFMMPDRWTAEEIESFKLTPEEAHRKAKEVIERCRHNQQKKKLHAMQNDPFHLTSLVSHG